MESEDAGRQQSRRGAQPRQLRESGAFDGPARSAAWIPNAMGRSKRRSHHEGRGRKCGLQWANSRRFLHREKRCCRSFPMKIMTSKYLIVFVAVAAVAACSREPKSATGSVAAAQTTGGVEMQKRQDGLSFETAVVLAAKTQTEGVAAQHTWIEKNLPGARPRSAAQSELQRRNRFVWPGGDPARRQALQRGSPGDAGRQTARSCSFRHHRVFWKIAIRSCSPAPLPSRLASRSSCAGRCWPRRRRAVAGGRANAAPRETNEAVLRGSLRHSTSKPLMKTML